MTRLSCLLSTALSEISVYVSLFGMAYLSVGVRAFQQQNVTQHRFKLIVPTSYVFSFVDLFVLYYGLAQFEHEPILTGLTVGTAAWMGAWTAIYLHSRM